MFMDTKTEEKITKLTAKLSKLEIEKENCLSTLDAYENMLDEHKKQISILKNENNLKYLEITELQKKSFDQETDVKVLKEANKNQKDQLLEEKIKSLEKDVNERDQKLKDKDIEIAKKEKQILERDGLIEDLMNNTKLIGDGKSKFEATIKLINKEKSELIKSKNELEKVNHKLVANQRILESKSETAFKQMSELESKYFKASQENISIKADFNKKDGSIKSLEMKVADIERNLIEYEQKIKKLEIEKAILMKVSREKEEINNQLEKKLEVLGKNNKEEDDFEILH